MEIIYFISLLCLTYLFTEGAEPIQWIKSFFKVSNDSEYINSYQWFFLKLFNCNMCFGFYVGLIYYNDLLLGCLVSIASEIFGRVFDRI